MSKNETTRMTTAERKALATQVKRVRLQGGMTQTDLAAAANVSRQTLSDIENGGRVPQDGVLRRILDVLGIEQRPSTHEDDTRMWLGLIGGVLDALPQDRRQIAGKNALDAATSELLPSVSTPDETDDSTNEDLGRQNQYGRAASDYSEDRGEDTESYDA